MPEPIADIVHCAVNEHPPLPFPLISEKRQLLELTFTNPISPRNAGGTDGEKSRAGMPQRSVAGPEELPP